MYDNAKEMAEDLAIETMRANEWEEKYTKLMAEFTQLVEAVRILIKERDDAVNDLAEQEDCISCRHFQPEAEPSNRCDLNPGYASDRYQCRWAWRGVRR